MTKQKESFSFDVPLELPKEWLMGVTSLVYTTVYIKTSNNKLEFVLKEKQLEELGLDTQLRINVVKLYEAYSIKYTTYNDDEYNKL